MKNKVKRIQTILECIDLRKKRVEEIESIIDSTAFKNIYPIGYKNSLLRRKQHYKNSIARLHIFLDMSICALVECQIKQNTSTEIYSVVKNNLIN